jgi:UDP-glucose 4-epimerase
VIDGRRRLLLLGGTGFIGTNLCHTLVAAGHDVFATGRKFDGAQLPPAVQTVPLPLDAVHDLVLLIKQQNIDTVVHLVSAMKPSSTFADYLAERDAILTPALRLANALARSSTRLVYFSSGGTIYGVGSGNQAAESDPCEPINYYGQSKLEIETHLRFLQRNEGLHTLIIRPSNPYGPHQALNGKQGLISVLLGRIVEDKVMEIWGDGSSVRDYIHVGDLVTTTCALIERGIEGTCNIGSGEGHSLLDVVRIVEQVTGRHVPLEFRPARAADVPRLVLDVGRLQNIGLHRSRPLQDGIRSYAARLGLVGIDHSL